MNESENQVLRVHALIHLHLPEAGGRETPAGDKYTPQVRVNGIDGYARLLLGENETMLPGAEGVVDLIVVGSQRFCDELRLVKEFSLMEGTKEIGRGVVESIHDHTTRASARPRG